jgi:hypothetical protein
MDDFDTIQGEIQRLAEQETNLQKAAGPVTEALERLRQARDRSFIVKCVIVLYGVVIGLAILYLIARGLLWKENTFDRRRCSNFYLSNRLLFRKDGLKHTRSLLAGFEGLAYRHASATREMFPPAYI